LQGVNRRPEARRPGRPPEESATAISRPDRRLTLPVLAAGAIGNVLEWYDFGLYGLFAPILAPLFFPAQDRALSLISAYGGFAIGFAMRPIGGAVLGHLGDRLGRRFILVYSIVLMGLATSVIALLPTYAAAGIGAPISLLLVRIVQGFSVGGEFTGSVAYLVETAPQRRRGLAGSVANIGSTAGMLLAAGVAAATTTLADAAQLESWAWRLPFLLGGLIALAGYFLRRRLPEATDHATVQKRADALPLRQAIKEAPGPMLLAVVFTSGYGVVNYLTMVFLPAYASEFGSIAENHALQANTAAQAVALLLVPLAGWLTDWAIRRRTMLALVFGAELVAAWGCFFLAGHGGLAGLWLAQILFGALLALVMGTAPATLSELFRRDYRLSGYSVSFNIGIGIAGGTAPAVAASLIAVTGDRLAPAWYLMIAAAVAAGAALMMKDRSRDPLR
jgi:MHS family proline/betaine transporter-like MFS transporter